MNNEEALDFKKFGYRLRMARKEQVCRIIHFLSYFSVRFASDGGAPE